MRWIAFSFCMLMTAMASANWQQDFDDACVMARVNWWTSLPQQSKLIAVLDGSNAGPIPNIWADLSGRGNSPTLYGNLAKTGNGVRSVRDESDPHAFFPSSTLSNLTALTAICVFTANSFEDYNFVYARFQTDAPVNADRFQAVSYSSGWSCGWFDSAASPICQALYPTSVAPGRMQSVNTWDGTAFTARLGTQQVVAATGTFNPNRTAPLQLFSYAPASYHNFNGTNHCFLLWSVALTSNEIDTAQSILNARWPGGLR